MKVLIYGAIALSALFFPLPALAYPCTAGDTKMECARSGSGWVKMFTLWRQATYSYEIWQVGTQSQFKLRVFETDVPERDHTVSEMFSTQIEARYYFDEQYGQQ